METRSDSPTDTRQPIRSGYPSSYSTHGSDKNARQAHWRKGIPLPSPDHQVAEPPGSSLAQGLTEFDPDYLAWRDQQLKAYDDDYSSWRSAQIKRHDDEYLAWRREASREPGA